ncbi:serine/threonine-protein kinase 17B [Spea bombifrons]|uniref:serine/threonine-protein kinase 17B n=1 Tax=Spea bombifrons TaxID=233779 RepID=UPI00234ADD54|nr:serine/threonine-protein kinase 17B [Spea bombifrons]
MLKRPHRKDTWSFMFTEIETSIKTENFHNVYILDSATLGRGLNAVVRKCTEKSTGRLYAAKILKKRRRGKDCRAEIIHEIAILELAKTSPHIVDFHEVYETDNEIILVLEYAAGGELFNLCVPDRNEALSEIQIIRILRQILEGVHFLHQNNIVHLDLKPQNILFSSCNPRGDIKIVDFGLSRKLSSTNELHEIMGTIDYTAPEILNYEPITTSADIWSVGVICYMLLTCESPFVGVDKLETYLNISQLNVDYSEDVFASVSEEAINFLRSTLVINPKERATVDGCLSHPWLQQAESIPLCSLDVTQSGETLTKNNKMKTSIKISNDVEDKENMPEYGSTAPKRLRYDDSQQNDVYV